jgi:AcrR family transcriptional regulator
MGSIPATADPYSFRVLAEGRDPLRPGPAVVDTDAVHRGRLIVAMADAVAVKGYAATTISDVVARARVSRRTFYEHFADKEACFLAAYDAAADLQLAAIDAAAGAEQTWNARLRAGVDAYLQGVAREPAITRVFLIEVLGAGPRALRRRRAVLARFAGQLRAQVELGRADQPLLRPLSSEMATAVVGGINELVLLAVEQDRLHELGPLQHAASELLRGVLTPEPPAAGAPDHRA